MAFSAGFIDWLGAEPGRRCLLAEIAVKTGGVETTRYLSNIGYASAPGDAPANQLYSGRISGMSPFTRRLDLDGGGGTISFGDIELDNEDGALDGWLDDVWAGRAINLYMGDAGDAARGIAKWPRSDFELVFAGTVDDIAPKSRGRLSLKVRDIFGPLNSTLSTATVGGTADNKDALRPIALGECFNITPVLLDAATRTYAVHLNSTVEGVLEARDNGIVVAATQTPAAGTMTLTNPRYGAITCDVQGAKIAGEWRTDAGGLIEWVATVLGDGNFITAGEIDAAALTAFRAACPQPLGLYITARANRLSVMRELAAAVGATVTSTYDGKMILVRVGFGASAGAITTRQMVDGSFAPLGRLPARGAIRMAAERNWTPQSASALAGAVTAEQIPIFENAHVTLSATDPAVLADWNQTATPEAIETLMIVESDVTAELARLLALWGTERGLYGFDGFPECFAYEIGETRSLTHPRFGLAGVPAQIVGIQHDWITPAVKIEVLI